MSTAEPGTNRCSLCGRQMTPKRYALSGKGGTLASVVAWVCVQCDMTPEPPKVK